MVLGYIYAVLNTTKYREEWAEFLDIDFPRIPFVDDKDEFLRLAKIGFDLVKIHLMEDKTLYEIRKKWKDYGKLEGTNFKVQSPKYDPIDQRFMINETTWLANVPKSVIELKIGAISNVDGVLGQYLKARRDRILDEDEQLHIQNIVKILLESIEKTGEIDNL
jgi:predicted helicase